MKVERMNVEQLMTRDVRSCRPDDSLNFVAQIMWDTDCGCVPVVDPDNRVIGMLTDRDVCMAAYTQGQRLIELPVSSAMSRDPFTCQSDDTIETAENVLREHQVRRLPVVDEGGCLVGILSLNDLACEAERERQHKGKRHITDDEVAATLGSVCGHRPVAGPHLAVQPRTLNAVA